MQIVFFAEIGPAATSRCYIFLCALLKVGMWVTARCLPGLHVGNVGNVSLETLFGLFSNL